MERPFLEQEEKEDSSDVDDGDLIGSEVKKLDYNGKDEGKNFKLKQLKIAKSLEDLRLWYN